jgi:hypothetical protein
VPTYCYRQGDTIFERKAPMARIPKWIVVNGRRATRDLATEHSGVKSGDPWVDHASLALMVHPLDIKAYEKDAVERGVPTSFRDDGCPKFTSPSHQRRYCQEYGYVNHDANWSAKD